MKIRWTNSSVRLRITPDELARLQSGENVIETFLAWNRDGWSVRVQAAPQTVLEMHGGDLQFSISPGDLAQLSEPEREGVYFSRDETRFYIEKDFPCAHPRAAEAAETPTPTFEAPQDFEDRKTPR